MPLTRLQVPIGPWPKDPKMKEIGRYQREHMYIGSYSFCCFFSREMYMQDPNSFHQASSPTPWASSARSSAGARPSAVS